MTYTSKELTELTSQELRDLIMQYSDYVTTYPENHADEGYPVCFIEWYENNYQLTE